jgi:hypothetical protein
MGSDGEDFRKSETPTPEVDDEGFSKQPATAGSNDPWSDFNRPSKNFYSSSDESGERFLRFGRKKSRFLLFDRKNRDFLRFGRKKSRFLRIAYKSES